MITNSHLNFRYLTASANLQTHNLKIDPPHTLLNTAVKHVEKKLSSSKQLAWNLYTVSHKVLENTKQANSSSFSTYFVISVTDANLLTHAEM